MAVVYSLLGVIIILAITGLYWRWASRRRQLPFPSWLSWLFLDNPLVDIIGGTQTTIERIGLRLGEHGLDVGCGTGRLSIPAAKKVGFTGKIVALDIQPEMLNRLQQKISQTGLSNIVTQCGDITTDDALLPHRFDRVWLVTVLGEIPDQFAALQNIYRLLKPGGTLSITEIIGDPHYQSRNRLLRLGQKAGFEPSQHWGTFLFFTQNFIKLEVKR